MWSDPKSLRQLRQAESLEAKHFVKNEETEIIINVGYPSYLFVKQSYPNPTILIASARKKLKLFILKLCNRKGGIDRDGF